MIDQIKIGLQAESDFADTLVIGDYARATGDGEVVTGKKLFGAIIPQDVRECIEKHPSQMKWLFGNVLAFIEQSKQQELQSKMPKKPAADDPGWREPESKPNRIPEIWIKTKATETKASEIVEAQYDGRHVSVDGLPVEHIAWMPRV